MSVSFRTVDDLNRCIIRNLPRIPRDVDVVVGIPRSGLLVASLIALYLNRPLTDLDGLLEGRLIQSGLYRAPTPAGSFKQARRILLIDDSVRTGREMSRALARIKEADLPGPVTSAAAYVSPSCVRQVDLAFEVCPPPRYFEWNIMHHSRMAEFCVDLDGVICADPTESENDDGPMYTQFLRQAEPLFLPTQRIGAIVTCRLEKYRDLTEEWLRRQGVQYDRLIMMGLPNKRARLASKSHAAFKAQAYIETGACLFIESSREQAEGIARWSGKPVVCLTQPELLRPSVLSWAKARIDRARKQPRKAFGKSWRYLSGWLRPMQVRNG